MRRLGYLAVVLLAAGACAPLEQDRVQNYTEDGINLYERGSLTAARDCFQAALALKPEDPDLVYNLGRCHQRMGQLEQAELLYRQCLQRNPDHLEARHAWVVLMVSSPTDRKKEAMQMVLAWRKSRPRTAGPYIEEGWLLARDGDLDSAQERYQQALGLEPRQPRALAEMGALYEKKGRRGRALVLYQRSLAANPDQPELVRLVSQMRGRVSLPHPD